MARLGLLMPTFDASPEGLARRAGHVRICVEEALPLHGPGRGSSYLWQLAWSGCDITVDTVGAWILFDRQSDAELALPASARRHVWTHQRLMQTFRGWHRWAVPRFRPARHVLRDLFHVSPLPEGVRAAHDDIRRVVKEVALAVVWRARRDQRLTSVHTVSNGPQASSLTGEFSHAS